MRKSPDRGSWFVGVRNPADPAFAAQVARFGLVGVQGALPRLPPARRADAAAGFSWRLRRDGPHQPRTREWVFLPFARSTGEKPPGNPRPFPLRNGFSPPPP